MATTDDIKELANAITIDREWTALDEMVKHKMLTYPTIYRTRIQALQRIFFGDSSAYWTKAGKLKFNTTEAKARLTRDEFIAEGFDAREKLEHATRFDNIDLFVMATNDYDHVSYIVLDLLAYGLPSYCAAYTAPENADETMLAGLQELIHAVCPKCRQIGSKLDGVLNLMLEIQARPCFDRQRIRTEAAMKRLTEKGFFEKFKAEAITEKG